MKGKLKSPLIAFTGRSFNVGPNVGLIILIILKLFIYVELLELIVEEVDHSPI